MARAIAPRPRLLLFDEPLTALDAKLRETLRVEINGLLRELGTTAIYVTHDQAEAMALGERIVVMSHGRIAQIGTPHQIYHHPADRFVADFIGWMNRVEGTLEGAWLHCPAGRIPADGAAEASTAGPAEAMFRPENVRLGTAEDAHLAGRLAASFFLGDRTRLLVEGIGAQPLIVDVTGPLDMNIGETVFLRIQSSIITAADTLDAHRPNQRHPYQGAGPLGLWPCRYRRRPQPLCRSPAAPDPGAGSGPGHRRSGRFRNQRRIYPFPNLTAPLGLPLHVLPGNHDDRDALRAAWPETAWRFQAAPCIR